jgi:lysophospholipase L1-like esterase
VKRFPAVAVLCCAALLSLPLTSRATGAGPGLEAAWVDTWVSMPQLTEPGNLPPAPFTGADAVFVDSTVRTTALVTLGGKHLRLRFSNAFGTTPLTLDAVRIALPAGGAAGVAAIDPATDKAVTFNGKASVTIPAGAQIVSDAVAFPVAPRTNVAVTVYLSAGQQSLDNTSHPGSRTTSWMLAGDHVSDADLDVTGAASVAHWYFLSAIEVLASPHAAAVVVVGDSISDGRGSTTNGNDRWPNQLAARLLATPWLADVAVLNQAAGGNRVLNDGLGPNVLARLDRDLLSRSGARWAIVFEGVNDIGTADATPEAQAKVARDLIDAYEQIVRRAHARGILVYGATITPFYGNGYYDAAGYREQARQAVNAWIRTSGRFDAVLDFDAAVRDPADPRQLRLDIQYQNDGLHMTPAGYKLIADAVDLRLFWRLR